MLAQFMKSDVVVPVCGIHIGTDWSMYMQITHIFNLAIITIALVQYKLFSLRPDEETTLIQEYPSVRH